MANPIKDKKNAMVELIERGEKSIYETQNVLARVWRIVLWESGIKGHEWQRRITKYQEKIIRISSKKGAANMKGNMTRRLVENRLSWTTLMRGFAIYDFVKVEVTFRLTDKNWKTREITIVIPNDELTSDLDDEETSE